jgi:glutathione S-transferase
MQLLGRDISPFVRRSAVSLAMLGFEVERRHLATTTDLEAIKAVNPLGRVPALVLDDGEVLIESSAILDWADEQAGPARALVPAAGAPIRPGSRAWRARPPAASRSWRRRSARPNGCTAG